MAEGLTDAQIAERLARIERNLGLLAEAAGIELEDPAAGIDPEVVELARSGRRMEAAQLLVQRTGTDFVEAQRVVGTL
jgi:hypothetical protein